MAGVPRCEFCGGPTEKGKFLFLVHVIDDDEAVRESLEALLSVAGYLVDTFESAEAYLSHLAADSSESICALLDHHMPGMNGLELLKALGRHEKPPSVLLLTASRDDQVRNEAMKLGAVDCLTKPVRQDVLLDGIERIRRGRTAP